MENKVKQEAILGNNKRIAFLNTTIDVLTMRQTVNITENYVQMKEPLHLIGVNADKINALNENSYLKSIVNSCGIINADGASVVMASKILGQPLPERVAGIDLMNQLIQLSNDKGYTIYLLGARQSVVNDTAKALKGKYKNLKIVGVRNGYFKENEWPEISKDVKRVDPDFVFVGITSPVKEYLVEFLQNDGNRCVFMGVGGSFDVISGNISRAPLWMQRMNIEWLFRVLKEPRRLFKRYFFGNFRFIKTVFLAKLRNSK